MKVNRKLETMCRGMALANLTSIGFPSDKIINKINESWHGYYHQAKHLINCIKSVSEGSFDGETTKEKIETWTK